MAKNKYDPQIGKNVIKEGTSLRGIAYQGSYPLGEVREKYNPSNGRYELVDQSGRAVGFVPKSWR